MTEFGAGERQEQARRRRFLTIVAALCGMGAVVGSVGGYLFARSELTGQPVGVSPLIAWAAVIAAVLAFAYGCWVYYKTIDEVDLVDNLWGSTAGFYAYAVLFGSWFALDFVDAAPSINHVAIFWVSLTFAGLVYVYRKWRAR